MGQKTDVKLADISVLKFLEYEKVLYEIIFIVFAAQAREVTEIKFGILLPYIRKLFSSIYFV